MVIPRATTVAGARDIAANWFSCFLFAIAVISPCGLSSAAASPLQPATCAEISTREPLLFVTELTDRKTVEDTIQIIESCLQRDAQNITLLNTATLLHLRLGWLYTVGEEREAHYFTSHDYALRAIEFSRDNFTANLLFTATKAKTAGYRPNAAQVKIAHELSDELQTLIRRNPKNADALYFFSWLNFKISQVSPVKKALASLFYGGLPDNLSFSSAVTLMREAINMRPGYLVYPYHLGYFYLQEGETQHALELFTQVSSMPPATPEDVIYQQRGKERLEQLQAAP